MAFPVSPTDGQEYTTDFGTRYKYYQSDDKWVKVGLVDDRGVTGSINFLMSGGGSAISTGYKGNVRMAQNFYIDSWEMYANETGSIYIDVEKTNYGVFPSASTMHGTATGPHIQSGAKNKDEDLSNWTGVTGGAGDVLRFNAVSVDTITNTTVVLNYHYFD